MTPEQLKHAAETVTSLPEWRTVLRPYLWQWATMTGEASVQAGRLQAIAEIDLAAVRDLKSASVEKGPPLFPRRGALVTHE